MKLITSSFKGLFFLSFVLILSASTLFAQGERPIIKIGVIAPLSGNMAFAGTDIRDGMLLAQEHLSGTHYSYRLIFEDNSLDLKQSVSAAKKLIDLDKVDAIVTLWPPTANVVAPITEAAKVLHYTIAWDPEIAKKHKYLLSHQAMVDSFVKASLRLLQQQGVKKLAFFQLNESGFNIGTDFLKQLAPKYEIALTDFVLFNTGQNDFRTEILKAKAKHVDGVLIWAVQPEMDTILKQLRQANITKNITGFFDVVKDLSLIEGLSFISEVYAADSFSVLFKTRFGKDFSLKAPNAYDIFNLLVSAFEKNTQRKLTAKELKAELLKTRDYLGAVGLVTINQDGNSSYPPALKLVQGSQLKTIDWK